MLSSRQCEYASVSCSSRNLVNVSCLPELEPVLMERGGATVHDDT